MLKKFQRLFLLNKWAVLLIIIGSVSWSLVMVKSGVLYDYGLGFWGPNGHDGVWHVAVVESLARGSLEMPVFSGETLQNYHIGFDLLLALSNRLTGISVSTLYFQIFPVIIALLVGGLSYYFVLSWTRSRLTGLWSTFFVYFGGSFGWLVSFFRNRGFGGESMFWSQQAVSTLVNPPFALSLTLLLLGLILLIKIQKSRSCRLMLLAALVFGVLIQIKAYAGILSLLGLLSVVIFSTLLHRKIEKSILLVFLGSLVISIILFLPLNSGSSSLLVFKPFWFLETMLQLSDRFYWPKLGEAMVNYRLGNIWIRAIPAYFIALLIFWYGNFATRVFAEVRIAKSILNYNKISLTDLFLITVLFVGVILPMLFLQEGTPWNTIQFLYYSLFASSILAGVTLGEWLEAKKTTLIRIIVVILVVVFTVPTTISTLFSHYLPKRPPAMLSSLEVDALNFLKDQPLGVVLTYPYDSVKAKEAEANPPRPLYLYESTAYVSAFSSKPVYLEDEVNLNITGFDWPARREKVEAFLDTLVETEAWSFLRENDISYIYWIKGQRARLGETQLGIERIFENDEVDIYKVVK